MSTSRPTELLVWGATGITGKRVCLELAKRYTNDVRWGIAGRNEEKLKSLKQELSQYHEAVKDVPVVVANIEDKKSIVEMVRQAEIVLACAGPFPLYSDAVVEACVDEGTHVLDVTGEVPWVKSIIDRFHEKAQRNGVKVINCCGFDSVPADMATFALVDHAYKRYGRGLSRALGCYASKNASKKLPFSGGTLASIVSIMDADKETQKAMSSPFYLNPSNKKPAESKARDQMWVRYDDDFKFWTSPFLMQGVNTRIVHRSSTLQNRSYGDGFYYGEGIEERGYLSAVGSSLGLFAIGFCVACSPIRRLLLKLGVLPKPGEGPTVEDEEKTSWSLAVHGLVSPDASDSSQQPITLKSHISDNYGGYTSTARMMLESALAIIRNGDALKREGYPSAGVLTPAGALGSVLLQRLGNIGIKTEILDH